MQTKSWSLYLVKNKLGSLYCGICTDLARRFTEHASDGNLCAKALRGKGPLSLAFAVHVSDRSVALKQEYWLKKQTRGYKLSVIAGNTTLPFDHQPYSSVELAQIQQHAYAKKSAKTDH